MFTQRKSEVEVAAMRESGRMLAAVLAHMKAHTDIGVSPVDMSHLAMLELRRTGCWYRRSM